jgi:lipopolysaccharide heptosyltransferase II
LKILLIRLRQIGDVVFTTPAVRSLRNRYPDAHIAYVVEPAAAPVLEPNSAINELIVAPRLPGWRGILFDLRLGSRLRRQAFDLAIDFHGGPRGSLLTWLSGASTRVGYRVAGRSWMYTSIVGRPRILRPRHSVENQWDLLGPLSISLASPEQIPVEMATTAAARSSVQNKLVRNGALPGDQIIVMHVSAGNPFRRWPIASFGEVAARLVAGGGSRRVFVTSGPSEIHAADQVVADARGRLAHTDSQRVATWGDDLPLAELRALVDLAVLYVGGDSGPMHVAATSHVPIVSIYGPTLPARSAPWRDARWPSVAVEMEGLECRPCDQRVCAPGDFRCLTRIDAQRVIEAAERLLPQSG